MRFFVIFMLCLQIGRSGFQFFHIFRHQGSRCIGIRCHRHIKRRYLMSAADSHAVAFFALCSGVFDVKLSALFHVEIRDLRNGDFIDSCFQHADCF